MDSHLQMSKTLVRLQVNTIGSFCEDCFQATQVSLVFQNVDQIPHDGNTRIPPVDPVRH